MNKTAHTITTAAIVIELSGKGAGRWYRICCWENTIKTSSEYFIMRGLGSNRKPRVVICWMLSGRKRRIAREACRADSPSWKPCCVGPVGTGEGISARIHAANSQGDRAEEGRRSDRRHNPNSLGVRVESCVTLVASIVVCVSQTKGVESSIICCKARKFKGADCRWVHHPLCHPRTLS